MWFRFAEWILDYGRLTISVVLALTLFLGYWALQVETDHSPGHFLATDAQVVQDYARARHLFGESQTLLYVVFADTDPFAPAFLTQLDTLGRRIASYTGVARVLSLANVPTLVRTGDRLVPERLYRPGLPPDSLQTRLQNQPFLRGLLLGKDNASTALLVDIETAFNDTGERVDLVDTIEAAARKMPGRVALAGIPYLRTQYAKRVTSEAPLFTLLSLLTSLLFLYLTFRAWRAVLLPTLVVALGIVWTIGLIALFGHRLNIVTVVLPALIVIIGMANAIHLMTKFFDQYPRFQDRREASMYTIQTVGLATFLTALTTAIGFGVLVFSGSQLLAVFGRFSSAGIMLLYGLSITLIPLALLWLRPPRPAPGRLSNHDGFQAFFEQVARITQHRSRMILLGALAFTLAGLFGLTRLSSEIYIFSDFSEQDVLRRDLAVFEQHFGGVLPLDVVIAARKPGLFRAPATLRKIEQLQQALETLEPVGRTLSAVNFMKLANQAYFGGHPAAYRLPAGYEMPFLQTALTRLFREADGQAMVNNMPRFVDSTFTTTRIHLGITDVGTSRTNAIVDSAQVWGATYFPPDQYEVFVTGTALLNTRSGENLITNLFLSLALALVVISVLMALLFRSARLTLISLAPNLLPLLLAGGVMGLSGILLRPSTVLIFPMAFGIAVDDTIHFLAKYRLLRAEGLPRDDAVHQTLCETGKAILFTSLVLMSGFLVFTLSGFGGTVTMGALTALTLGAALITNLFLLPTLLYRFAPDEPLSLDQYH